MKARITLVAVLWLCCAAAPGLAQTIYHTVPDWVSADTQVSTGAALVDLNRDGWLDLVVSNGNDMQRQHVVVYYNRGDGTFPPNPDWQSADIGYHGHLDVADVNADGWPDVAVAMLLNEGGPAAKLYLNNNGTLSSLPDWTSAEAARAFGVAFGDMNNDGRPDLAVATGWPYDPGFNTPNTVHLNIGGQLEVAPSWQSSDTYHLMGVLWVDADDDGWLDLIGVGTQTYTWLYHNNNGVLSTTAGWHTTDNVNQYAIMATAGDVTGDGRRDLFVTDNTQLYNGHGYFRQYTGQATGYFTTSWTWGYYDGYGSAVALADVNADGKLDLATGAWWDYTRVFLNTGTGFLSSPHWNSGGTSVVEKIVFGDIDKNGLRPITETFPAADSRRLFYLAHQPIQEITAVRCDGVPLGLTQYAFGREHGWVTVSTTPATAVEVDYTYSSKLDMAVVNWDDTVGNFVYYNQLAVMGDANCDGRLDLQDVPLFVLLLVDRPAYDAEYPDCDAGRFCDLNGDGALDGDDIQLFVDLLL